MLMDENAQISAEMILIMGALLVISNMWLDNLYMVFPTQLQVILLVF